MIVFTKKMSTRKIQWEKPAYFFQHFRTIAQDIFSATDFVMLNRDPLCGSVSDRFHFYLFSFQAFTNSPILFTDIGHTLLLFNIAVFAFLPQNELVEKITKLVANCAAIKR